MYVKVGTAQREKRFPPETPIRTMQHWRDEARVALRALRRPVQRATLRADALRYLAHQKTTLAPATYASRVCEIEAWFPAFADVPRDKITRDMILEERQRWLSDPKKPLAPKTCNHRTRALRHLYRYLDGKHVPTPLDDVPKLKEPDAQPQFVDVRTIKRVAARLTNPQTRGRFMVLTSTGMRPAQLKRARPGDVDLRRRLWLVRAAKGGNVIPVVLTDDMVAAFRVFIAAKAWSEFDPETGALLRTWDSSDYAKALYAAGWPRHIRPYNAKHTVAIALANTAADWEDIKDWFGHKDVKSTRIYTGQVLKRLQRISQKLAGRIGW